MRIPGPWRLLAGFAFLLIVGAAMATWLYAHQRMQAIRYVRSHGGSIDFADGHDGSRVPDWLRGVQSIVDLPGGSDLRNCAALSDATNLFLQQTRDDDLLTIGRFRQLKLLSLHEPHLTPRGLRHVRACPRLRSVAIWWSPNGDELLEALDGLPLTALDLRGAPIIDAGLRHLAGMPLEELELSDTHITDAGMAELARLPALSQLDVHGSKVSDGGLRHLSSLRLRSLVLAETNVTDAGLSQLAGMPLTYLALDGTSISDAGLTALKALPLQELSLTRTRVTPGGVRVLSGMKGLMLVLSRPPFGKTEQAEFMAAGIRVILIDSERER